MPRRVATVNQTRPFFRHPKEKRKKAVWPRETISRPTHSIDFKPPQLLPLQDQIHCTSLVKPGIVSSGLKRVAKARQKWCAREDKDINSAGKIPPWSVRVMEQTCPRCQTSSYQKPSMKLLVNVCGHRL